jgi:hypothetical protein
MNAYWFQNLADAKQLISSSISRGEDAGAWRQESQYAASPY